MIKQLRMIFLTSVSMSAWHFCSWGEEKLLVKHHIYSTQKNIFKGNICFLQCIITQKLQTLAFFSMHHHTGASHICSFLAQEINSICYLLITGTNAYKARNHIMFTISLHCSQFRNNDDVIKWKLFPRYWPLVRGIHQSPVNSPHKEQWRGALMLCLICAWINDWINNPEAGDLRRRRTHYDIIVMTILFSLVSTWWQASNDTILFSSNAKITTLIMLFSSSCYCNLINNDENLKKKYISLR